MPKLPPLGRELASTWLCPPDGARVQATSVSPVAPTAICWSPASPGAESGPGAPNGPPGGLSAWYSGEDAPSRCTQAAIAVPSAATSSEGSGVASASSTDTRSGGPNDACPGARTRAQYSRALLPWSSRQSAITVPSGATAIAMSELANPSAETNSGTPKAASPAARTDTSARSSAPAGSARSQIAAIVPSAPTAASASCPKPVFEISRI